MTESGYYPPGAEHDPSAPWNERDDYTLIIEMDYYGEVVLIQRTYIAEDDWEDETKTINAETMSSFLASELNIDIEEMWEDGEDIDIEEIIELKNETWDIITSHGKVNVSWRELEELN